MSAWTLALASVLVVSAVPLAGLLLLSRDQSRIEAALLPLVSFAVGAMLGGAFLHILPEAVERTGGEMSPFVYLLAGFLGFFVLEKFLWRGHRHGVDSSASPKEAPFAVLNLVGDGIHNLIDGMVIAVAFLVDTRLGLTATLAVLLHEIPQELGDFAVLVYGGFRVHRAVFFNLLSGLLAVVGAVIALVVGSRVEAFATALLPLAAGSFVYIAASDLVPELHRVRRLSTSAWQIVLMLLGAALVSLPRLLE